MIWVELDGGVCYELGDDSSLLVQDGSFGRTTLRESSGRFSVTDLRILVTILSATC